MANNMTQQQIKITDKNRFYGHSMMDYQKELYQQQDFFFQVLLPIFQFLSTMFYVVETPWLIQWLILVSVYQRFPFTYYSFTAYYYFITSFFYYNSSPPAGFQLKQSINLMKRSSIFSPVLADISKQGSPSFLDFYSPQSLVTYLQSRSILLAMRKRNPLPTLFSLKRLSHISVQLKEALEVTSNTIKAQCASLRQLGMRDLNLSWPAVSHSCMRQFLALCEMFLARKSMPTVGWVRMMYIGCLFKTIVNVLFDYA